LDVVGFGIKAGPSCLLAHFGSADSEGTELRRPVSDYVTPGRGGGTQGPSRIPVRPTPHGSISCTTKNVSKKNRIMIKSFKFIF